MGSRGASAKITEAATKEARAIEKTISTKQSLVSRYEKKWIGALGGMRMASNDAVREKYSAEAGKWYDKRNQAEKELNEARQKLDKHLRKYKLGFYGERSSDIPF